MRSALRILLFFLIPLTGSTQKLFTPKFEHIKIPTEEPGSINAHQWDQDGNFWFISGKKLGMYNGNSFTFYTHQPDNANSLLNANIVSAYLDEDNIFWLGYLDQFAITKFNPKTKKYTHYYADSSGNNGIPNAPVIKIKKGKKDELLLFSWGGGFSIFNKTTEKAINFSKKAVEDSTWIQSNRIKDGIYIDDDQLLFGYFREGHSRKTTPAILNEKTGTITPFPYEDYIRHLSKNQQQLIKRNLKIINFIHQDANKNLWFGSYSSLLFFNTATQKAKRIILDTSQEENLNIVNARICEEDQNGKLWVSTFNSGILYIDIHTLEAQYLKHNPNDPNSIGGNTPGVINTDPMKNIWIHTGRNEFSIYNPYLQKFELEPWINMDLKFTNNSAQIIPVNQMFVKKDGKILISSSNGLHLYNPATKQSQTLIKPDVKYNAKLNFEASGLVNNFKLQKDQIFFDNRWAIFLYDTTHDHLRTVSSIRGTPMFRHHNEGDTVFFQHHRTIYYYHPEFRTLEKFDTLPRGIDRGVTNNRILKDGRWIVGVKKDQFHLYDPKKKESKVFSKDSEEHPFPDSTILSTYVDDTDGLLWIGTENGAYTFNPETFAFVKMNAALGISREPVYAFIRDLEGDLWVALNKDILVLKQNGTKFRYTSEFGVKAGQFLPSVAQMDETGRIYLASLNGVIHFHPKELQFSNFPFTIDIDKLLVNGSVFKFDPNTFTASHPLYLNWDENFISFELKNNQIYAPKAHQYYYRIKGVHEDWQDNSVSNVIRFSGLSYGDYILEIKAVNAYDQESEVLELHFTIQKPFWLTFWFYGMIIIIVGIAIFLWVKQREKRMVRQRKVLEQTVQKRTAEVVEKAEEIQEQKDIIEAKNIELTDSIVYAERIQKAILPPQQRIDDLLGDAFVLYQPKDIIAGDFYFLEVIKNENSIIYAAADCTGHGVPGAIVSVVCNNALQRSLRENKLTHPANILNHSRDLIINEFEKGSEDVKDGMDIALVRLPLERTEQFWMEYAGANNPIWIIRPRNNQEGVLKTEVDHQEVLVPPNKQSDDHYLFDIRPDKQPIGKYLNATPFTNHRIQVQKGDTLYVFSDGFADQFGSFDHGKPDKKGGKKLKTANFKKLVLNMQNLTLGEQKEHLHASFEKWRGNIEQIDDVCIIGVKI